MRLISLCVLVVILCSCGGYTVPNEEGCLQKTRGTARCKHFFTDGVRELSKAEWDLEKLGTICYKPQSVGNILFFIEKVCNQSQNCVTDLRAKIEEGLKAHGYRLE